MPLQTKPLSNIETFDAFIDFIENKIYKKSQAITDSMSIFETYVEASNKLSLFNDFALNKGQYGIVLSTKPLKIRFLPTALDLFHQHEPTLYFKKNINVTQIDQLSRILPSAIDYFINNKDEHDKLIIFIKSNISYINEFMNLNTSNILDENTNTSVLNILEEAPLINHAALNEEAALPYHNLQSLIGNLLLLKKAYPLFTN